MFRRKKSSSDSPRAGGGIVISKPMPIATPLPSSGSSAPLYERFARTAPEPNSARPSSSAARLSTTSNVSGLRPTASSGISSSRPGTSGENTTPLRTRTTQQQPQLRAREKENKQQVSFFPLRLLSSPTFRSPACRSIVATAFRLWEGR